MLGFLVAYTPAPQMSNQVLGGKALLLCMRSKLGARGVCVCVCVWSRDFDG